MPWMKLIYITDILLEEMPQPDIHIQIGLPCHLLLHLPIIMVMLQEHLLWEGNLPKTLILNGRARIIMPCQTTPGGKMN